MPQSEPVDRIQSYFAKKWADFKQAWEECGLAHAVVKAGVDGVFFLGEIAVGAGALKAVRFSYRVVKGRHRVDVIPVGSSKSLGHADWSEADLNTRYKKPDQNIVGGKDSDKVNTIPLVRDRRAARRRNGRRTTKSQTVPIAIPMIPRVSGETPMVRP